MNPVVQSTLCSALFHAIVLGVLCWIPSTIANRFTSAGRLNVFSIELQFNNSPANDATPPIEVSIETDVIDDTEPTVQPKASEPTPIDIPVRKQNNSLTEQFEAESSMLDVLPELVPDLTAAFTRRSSQFETPEANRTAESPPRRTITSQFTAAQVNLPFVDEPVGLASDVPAKLSFTPPPKYPSEAVRRRMEGIVLLRLRIDSSGKVKTIEVIESSGHGLLDRAATEAVRNWRGQPANRHGRAVESEEVLPVRFHL